MTGTDQRPRRDEEGEPDLLVAAFLRLHVEHELDERPLETGARPRQDREAGSAELRRAGQIEHPERGSQLVMRSGLEIEGPRGPGAPNLLVGLLVEADRHALVSQVGKLEQALLELLFGGTHPLFLSETSSGARASSSRSRSAASLSPAR